MSFYTYYQAIPERSRLLERLRCERALCTLYTGLIVYGPGPFHFEHLDPEERRDILDGFVGREPFRSREEVDRCVSDMKAELCGAVAERPGLDRRAAYIEKLHDEI